MKRVNFFILYILFSIPSLFAEPIDITDWYNENAVGVPDLTYHFGYAALSSPRKYYHFGEDSLLPLDDIISGLMSGEIIPSLAVDNVFPVYRGVIRYNSPNMSYYEFSIGDMTFQVAVGESPFLALADRIPFEGVEGVLAFLVLTDQVKFLDDATRRALAELYDIELSEPDLPPIGNVESNDVVSSAAGAIAITLMALAYGFYAFSGFGGMLGGGRG